MLSDGSPGSRWDASIQRPSGDQASALVFLDENHGCSRVSASLCSGPPTAGTSISSGESVLYLTQERDCSSVGRPGWARVLAGSAVRRTGHRRVASSRRYRNCPVSPHSRRKRHDSVAATAQGSLPSHENQLAKGAAAQGGGAAGVGRTEELQPRKPAAISTVAAIHSTVPAFVAGTGLEPALLQRSAGACTFAAKR